VRAENSVSWFRSGDRFIELYETGLAEPARPLAIFLHGRYGDASLWGPLIDEIGTAARTISVNLPGFGASYCVRQSGLSLVEGILLVSQLISERAEPADSVLLVGHDVGATIALMSTVALLERLAGIVLLNGCCPTRPPKGLRSGPLSMSHRMRVARQCSAASATLSRTLRRRIMRPWNDRHERKARSRALDAIRESWPRHYEQLAWKRELSRVELPALLLWGARDVLNPPEAGAELFHQLPNAEFLEDSASSHWLMLENPAWVGARMREFIFRAASPTLVRRSLSR
jgi:pimeloyl-ACP methyl ester carboxylesterase